MSHPPFDILLQPIRMSRDWSSFDRQPERPFLRDVPNSARHPPRRRVLSPLKVERRNSATYVPMCVLPKTARLSGRENNRPIALPTQVVCSLAMEKANAMRDARLGLAKAEQASAGERAARPELQFKVEVIVEQFKVEDWGRPIPPELLATRSRVPAVQTGAAGAGGGTSSSRSQNVGEGGGGVTRRRRAISELEPGLYQTKPLGTVSELAATRPRSAESPTRQLVENVPNGRFQPLPSISAPASVTTNVVRPKIA